MAQRKRMKVTNVRYGASFDRNGDKLLDLLNGQPNDDNAVVPVPVPVLVHALIAPRDGSDRPFAYCWIEVGDEVLDFTSGDELRVSKPEWAANWQIERAHKYEGRDAARRIDEAGSWGPWDFADPRAAEAVPERPGRFDPRKVRRLTLAAQMAMERATALADAEARGEPVSQAELESARADDARCFTAMLEALGLPNDTTMDVDEIFAVAAYAETLARNTAVTDEEILRQIELWPDVEIDE